MRRGQAGPRQREGATRLTPGDDTDWPGSSWARRTAPYRPRCGRGWGAHHRGPVRQDPRNQGLRTAALGEMFLSGHCCHTLFVKPRAQPRHTQSTWEKHSVSRGAPSPAQPSPPPPQVLRHDRPCPCPPRLEIQLGPTQMPPPAWLADISAARGGPTGCRPALSRPSLVSRPQCLPPSFSSCPHAVGASLALCAPPPPPHGPNQSSLCPSG